MNCVCRKAFKPSNRPNKAGPQKDGGERKIHWENVYETRPLETVGWYQPVPRTSLELISGLKLPKEACIIDIGGGDSYLTDHLLRDGYGDLTVLDISGTALERARQRLGRQAGRVSWVESDILEFIPKRTYDLWHDRATFHFLTKPSQVASYLACARQGIRPGGYLILGTFSDRGPDTCSGLPVQRYSIAELQSVVAPDFDLMKGINLSHYTPSGGAQEYTFGVFAHFG